MKLLVAPGIATSNKGTATRSKDATSNSYIDLSLRDLFGSVLFRHQKRWLCVDGAILGLSHCRPRDLLACACLHLSHTSLEHDVRPHIIDIA